MDEDRGPVSHLAIAFRRLPASPRLVGVAAMLGLHDPAIHIGLARILERFPQRWTPRIRRIRLTPRREPDMREVSDASRISGRQAANTVNASAPCRGVVVISDRIGPATMALKPSGGQVGVRQTVAWAEKSD